MLMLAASRPDCQVQAVSRSMQRRGRDVFLVSKQDLGSSTRFVFDHERLQARFTLADGSTVSSTEFTAIYHRIDPLTEPDPELRVMRGAQIVVLSNFMDEWPGLVVNRPRASHSNVAKPFQLALLESLGFNVPRTRVTNRPEEVRAFYEHYRGEVIFKSISSRSSIVRKLKAEDLERLHTLKDIPIQLQECIPGVDVRVHVIGDQIFATRIEADTSDYRNDDEAHFTPWTLAADVESLCFSGCQAMGMRLAGIDFRLTPDGRYYCLEANPGPGYYWFEERTGQPMTEALTDLLMSGQPLRSSKQPVMPV